MSLNRIPHRVNGHWLAKCDLDRDLRTSVAVALSRGEATMTDLTTRQIAAITGIAERTIRDATATAIAAAAGAPPEDDE